MPNTDKSRPRVLLIALDAAEPTLIERWSDEGRLPHLRKLRHEGSYGRLRSSAEWLAGSPWPVFHTGTSPGENGLYHFVQWHPERMTMVRPTSEWLPVRPFWRDVADGQRRVIAIDPSSTYPAESLNGIEIVGWYNNDTLVPPYSLPADTLERARREFGVSAIEGEVYAMERPRDLLRLRDELVRCTRRTGDLGLSLMRSESWGLFMICLTATHRGGHKLWDATAARGEVTGDTAEELSGALLQVYSECDEVVGRLVEAAGPETTVLVFSLHGMGPNISRVLLVGEMLDRILTGGGGGPPKAPGVLQSLRRRIPVEWRNVIKNRLPYGLQDRLTVFWRVGDLDMATTRAFPVIADLQGYIRINVKGREARGIVEPGEEYDRLCDEISTGFESFRDADNGEPVVERVARADRLYPGATRLRELPDLIVRWSSRPAREHRALVSDRYGSIPWPTPGRHPEGRAGNHRSEGFMVARGHGIRRGASIEGAGIVDLAPTVGYLLGLTARPEWTGKILLPNA